MFRRAWGRAPVPVCVVGNSGHDWFYRRNRNLLPLSYGEVWAAQHAEILHSTAEKQLQADFGLLIDWMLYRSGEPLW